MSTRRGSIFFATFTVKCSARAMARRCARGSTRFTGARFSPSPWTPAKRSPIARLRVAVQRRPATPLMRRRRRIRLPAQGSPDMILEKFFRAIRAQLNKIANVFFESDPIAVMQLEVDQATEKLKEGRKGLEMYRGLVETVARQVAN